MRLPEQILRTMRPKPQVRFGTVTSVATGICTVQVAGGEIPAITMNGAAIAVGDFVAVQRQSVASYVLNPASAAPWEMGQVWWAQDNATGTYYWLAQPYYYGYTPPPGTPPAPSFGGGVFRVPTVGAPATGFLAIGSQTAYALSSSLQLRGTWTLPFPAVFPQTVPGIFPALGAGLMVGQPTPPAPVTSPSWPPVQAAYGSLATGAASSVATNGRYLVPSGAPCFDLANAFSSYSNGMFFSERDQVVYLLGIPGRDGYTFEWDALSLTDLNVVSYASGSALGNNALLSTNSGSDVGIVQVDQKTGYAWCLTQDTTVSPAIHGVFVVDPKTGAIIAQPLASSPDVYLVVNVDAESRTAFLAQQQVSSPGAWSLLAVDADSYTVVATYDFPSAYGGIGGGAYTMGIDPSTGSCAYVLGTFIAQLFRSGAVNTLLLPSTTPDPPFYFATGQ